jgi:hypothetical protein
MPPALRRIAWLFTAAVAVGCHTDRRDESALDLLSIDSLRSGLTFGPKAARLEVSPAEAANPTKAQQVLVATVYDADGRPRRNERVEWALDGPGHITASDESRLLTSRGHRADSRSAVTYTDYFEGTADRGTADSADDFAVRAGQTWVVVASAVEGETTVTARAPDVPDREQARVVVKLTWSDSQFDFPSPAVTRPGGDAELLTTLNRLRGQESPDGLRVRYRVLDGAPAELVSVSGSGTTAALSGGGQTEVEVPADADGKAAVRVVQPTPRAGTTRIAIDVVKPDPKGLGDGTVVGRKITTVEWAAAQLSFDADAPKAAAVGRDTVFNLVVSNAGKAESRPVTVKAALPDAAEFVRSDPPPTSRRDGELVWALDPVSAGGKQTVALTVRPTRRGPLTVPASAETPDGVRAESRAMVSADTAGLKVGLEFPSHAGVGDPLTARVAVTNPGAVPLANATAWVGFDNGLANDTGANPAEVRVGTVPPGDTRHVEIPLTAKEKGRFAVRVSVTADGGLNERAEAAVEVRNAALKLSLSGPESVTLGQEADWELRVTNAGDVAVPEAVARINLPEALAAKSATDGGRLGSGGAEWRLGPLAPGAKKVVRLTAAADRLTDRATVSATAHGEGSDVPVQAQAEVSVAVLGKPALGLQLADVPGLVTAGRRAAVRVTVRNRGSGPARKVEVSATATESFRVLRGTGADRQPGRLDGQTVTFGVLDELPAGATAVFVVELEAAQAGAARVRAEVRAEHLPQPLREEQAAKVVGGS